MTTQLQQYAADHRFLLETVERQVGFESPVSVDMDEFYTPLVKAARRGPLLPIEGVLVRNSDPDNRHSFARPANRHALYTIEGIRFVRVRFATSDTLNCWGLDFAVVETQGLSPTVPRLPCAAAATMNRPASHHSVAGSAGVAMEEHHRLSGK